LAGYASGSKSSISIEPSSSKRVDQDTLSATDKPILEVPHAAGNLRSAIAGLAPLTSSSGDPSPHS
jgi:hypothetical protein